MIVKEKIIDPEVFQKRLNEMQKALLLKGVAFAKRLGIKPSYLTSLRKGRSKAKGFLFWNGIQREFPEWVPWLRGETENPPAEPQTKSYRQEEEKVLPHPRGGPARDMDAGSYGTPDLSGFKVVTVVQPQDAIYIQKVQEIFKSDQPATASALKANIDQFYEKVQDRKRVRSLEKRVEDLEGKAQRTKNGSEPSGGSSSMAEEGR